VGLWLPAHALACPQGGTVLAQPGRCADTLHHPGSPWENGYIERFDGRLRNELLDLELLHTLWEVKVLVERWRQTYNRIRPHSALDYRPPALEAVRLYCALLTLRPVQLQGAGHLHPLKQQYITGVQCQGTDNLVRDAIMYSGGSS
jgi:hypothetical protein